MPLVRIDLPAGRPAPYRSALGDAVQQAPHDGLGVPFAERFRVIIQHGPDGLAVDPGYSGVSRSGEAAVIQVTLNRRRDAAKKAAFFTALAGDAQTRAGIRREDIVVNLIEVGREDWSFGNGKAQLV